MQDYSPMHVAWLRYFSALVTAFVAILLIQRKPNRFVTPPMQVFQTKIFPWVGLMALTTFFFSPLFQYVGLAMSTSTANTLLVAMEPLFAALLAWALIGEPWRKVQGLAFCFAVAGFLLLSNLQPGEWSSLANFQAGNLFFLAAMPMEAMYSIVSRKVGGRVGALTLYLAASLLGFFLFSCYLIFFHSGLPSLSQIRLNHLGAILWMGSLGTAITYIYWTVALEKASVAAVSLTLFVQPILGAFVGALFLKESLSYWQFIGALSILLALSLETFFEIRKGKPHVANN